MRLADVTLAFPTLLLLIAIVAAVQPSLTVVFATIGVVGWAGMARLVRGQALVVRQLEYVQAVRALGARDMRIVARHLLPNVAAPVIIAATLGVAGAIMAEAALSFLGFGRPAANPELGRDDRRRARPRSTPPRPLDIARRRAWRLARRCWDSTCWVTPCVTRWIRARSALG